MHDFAYNETPAQEYFPVEQSVALARGYAWQSTISAIHTPKKTDLLDIKDMPDHIRTV